MFSQRSNIHSKTCRKYQNTPCQFNFGQFFTDRTMVAEPLSDDFSKEEKIPLSQEELLRVQFYFVFIAEFVERLPTIFPVKI